MKLKVIFVATLALTIYVLTSVIGGKMSDTSIEELINSASLANAQDSFNQNCGHCHSLVKGEHRIGPSLFNFIDRKSASVHDFLHYSETIKGLDIVWTQAELFRLIRYGRSYTDQINMAYEGISSDEEASKIVKFLIEQSEN